MPTKDNIKQFNTAKRAGAAKPTAKNSSKKVKSANNIKQNTKKKSSPTAKKTAHSSNTVSYKEVRHEINERHKIENLQNREEKRVARNEDKRQRHIKSEQSKTVRKQKRAQRRANRREGFEYTFSNKVASEVVGIMLIGFGIFMFMCLVSSATGFFGKFMNEFMHGFFGYFAYVLPVAIIVGGVFMIINATRSVSVKMGKAIVAVIAIYLLLAWLQLFPYSNGKFDDDTFMIFIKSTYNKGLDSIGTGMLASILSYWVVYLFGMAGAKFLLLLCVIASILFATNRSLGRMTQLLIGNFKEKERVRKEKERILVRSEMHNVNRTQTGQNTGNDVGSVRSTQKSQIQQRHIEYSEPPISGFSRKKAQELVKPEPVYEENAEDERYDDHLRSEEPEQYRDGTKGQSAERTEQRPRKNNIISLKNIVKKNESVVKPDDGKTFDRPTITEMPEITGEERPMNVTVDGEILDDGSVQSVAAPVDGAENGSQYIFPSLDLLEAPTDNDVDPLDEDEVYEKAKAIEQTMSDFGIAAKVINITHGPVITRYECSVPSGTKMSKVTSLDKELAYSLECASIRIEAPIPNKAAIGIEVPNQIRSTVYLRELLESQEFVKKESLLAFAVGKDIAGNIIIGDIAKMPHTLICGATGSGKSVFVNGILMSLLYKASPSDVKLIMVDPKKVEFEKYRGIPHLLFPVVSNPKRAAGVLAWCVKEMEDRYEKMAKVGVRDLRGYNKLMRSSPSDDPDLQPLPLIVIVIDELSDLMVVARDEVEDHIYRLAQMARAAGMYLLIATQRPSVDVVTGVIKANIPSRIALKTSSPQDSRTILNTIGAEQLLGNGDMIYKPQGLDRSLRVQGAWVSDDEVEKVVAFVRSQNIVSEQVQKESLEDKISEIDKKFVDAANTDELLPEAIAFVVKEQEASVSMLQRRFRIGHGRAGNLIDEMEKRGVVGPHIGSKPREVLITKEEYDLGFTPEDKNVDY